MSWFRLENVKLSQDVEFDNVFEKACFKYKINKKNIEEYRIVKKSIDARDKNDVHYNYTIDVNSKLNIKNAKKVHKETINLKKVEINRKSKYNPVIVGSGPAGLFCALVLAYNGIKPIIIEQGKKVEERKKDVEKFWHTGKLNPNSNAQFGEGGAGTFSDGKLTTGIHNPLVNNVLEEFAKFGAPEQILYESKPHIGTDNLIKIVANIRNEIIKLGGTFLFEEKVTDIIVENSELKAIKSNRIIETDTAVFAIRS